MTGFRPIIGMLALGWLLSHPTPCGSAEVPATPTQQTLGALSPGDAVTIRIYGQPDSDSVTVRDDGTIDVPLAGAVQVGGMTAVDAAGRVAKALKDGGYFVDPHVTLVATEARSQLVSVIGEV